MTNIYLDERFATRFWATVTKTPTCWTVPKQKAHRYRQLKVPHTRRSMGAHRLSWILHYGQIPDGLCVCHRCDNTWCVRPDHLFLATSEENTADKVRKGRQATGEHINSKLTPDDVRAMRAMYATGQYTLKQTGDRFGVSDSCVEFVVKRVSWKHIA